MGPLAPLFATLIGALGRLAPALATGISAFTNTWQNINPPPPLQPGQNPSFFQQFLNGANNKQGQDYRDLGGQIGGFVKFASNPVEPISSAAAFGTREGINMTLSAVKALRNPLTSFGEQIKQLTDEVIESKRSFADLNGQVAYAYNRLNLSREYGAIDLANRQANTTAELINQQIRFEAALRPLTSSVDNIKNSLLARVLEISTWLIENGNTASRVLGAILDRIDDLSPELALFRTALNAIAEGGSTGGSPDKALRDFLKNVSGRIGEVDAGPIRGALPWGPQPKPMRR